MVQLEVSGMTTKEQESALPRPSKVEPGWATKIAKAKEAREQGRKAREGRPATVQAPRFARRHSA
jgi:hypothetical protein